MDYRAVAIYIQLTINMEEISVNLLIGIVSGVISAALVVFVQYVFKKNVLPKIEEFFYDELRIEGKWSGEWEIINDQEHAKGKDSVMLYRNGHNIWGDVTCLDGYDKGSEWGFKGTFKNNILTATYYDKDLTMLSRGAFSLKLKKNGQVFEGKNTFYSEENDEISSGVIIWKRELRESPSLNSMTTSNGSSTNNV